MKKSIKKPKKTKKSKKLFNLVNKDNNSNPYISRETFEFMNELDKGDLDDYKDFK